MLHAQISRDLIFKLRKALGKSFAGKLMDCFNCLSLWVSVPFALVIGGSWLEWILLWISFSGGAILLNHVTGDPGHVPPAKYFEDP